MFGVHWDTSSKDMWLMLYSIISSMINTVSLAVWSYLVCLEYAALFDREKSLLEGVMWQQDDRRD